MMNKKLDKKLVQQAAWTNVFFHHCAQNYERMMGLAFCHTLSKPLEVLYPDKEDYKKALMRHMNFYNTEPTLGSIIPGVILGLEEGKANGEPITEELILGTKTALMGPFAGIGDSLIGATYNSIIASIAIGLSEGGSLLGVIFFLIFHAAGTVLMKYGLFMKGYELGLKALDLITPKVTDMITTCLGIAGLITVGGVTANTVNVPIAFSYVSGDMSISLQSIVDKIMPGLLPLCLTIGLWWLYTRKNWSSVKALVTLLVVTIVCVYLGIM